MVPSMARLSIARRTSIPFVCLVSIVIMLTTWMLCSRTHILQTFSSLEKSPDTKVYYSNSSLLAQQNKALTKDCIYGHIANMAPICGADGGCLQVEANNYFAFTHTHIHTHTQTHAHTHTHTHMHTSTHTHNTHTCTQTLTHTHTHTLCTF